MLLKVLEAVEPQSELEFSKIDEDGKSCLKRLALYTWNVREKTGAVQGKGCGSFTLHGTQGREQDWHNRKKWVLVLAAVLDQCEHFCLIF